MASRVSFKPIVFVIMQAMNYISLIDCTLISPSSLFNTTRLSRYPPALFSYTSSRSTLFKPGIFKMKFSTLVASSLLMATAALASPLTRRATALGKGVRRSAMNHNLTAFNPDEYAAQASSNWAGAAIVSSGVTQASGTFVIPKPQPPPGGSSDTQYCGAAWVGIDGDTCQTGLIQTGVFWCVQDGEYSFEAWYEYIDAASIAYSGISVNAGDTIQVHVIKTGSNSGTTTLENVSTGVTKSHTFTNDHDGTLCGQNAEWIVEDFEEGSSLVPFANFETVTFTGATAVIGGQTVTPGSSGATNLYIESNSGKKETSTTISGGTVTVEYV